MDERARTLDLSRQMLCLAHSVAESMRPPLVAPDRPRCALFLTITEQFEATLRLTEVGLATHAAVHVRSMLEALASMRLLAVDSDYIEQLKFDALHGEKKLYEDALAFTGLDQQHRPYLQARLDDCVKRYKPAFDRGLRKSVIGKKVTQAGLSNFLAPYGFLSSCAHSDLAALANRHQGKAGMVLRAGDPDDVVIYVMQVAMHLQVMATEPLREIAEFPAGNFEKLFSQMLSLYVSAADEQH